MKITTECRDEKKRRVIILYKQAMFDEVDAHTSKWVEAAQPEKIEQQNAISSDTTEDLDGAIVTRLMDNWKSRLCRIIKSVLAEVIDLFADDAVELANRYRFTFDFPEEFEDAMLEPFKDTMHKYIVWGILYDWYRLHGVTSEAAVYKQELDELKKELESDIHPDGYAKRPMQPFGPAHF